MTTLLSALAVVRALLLTGCRLSEVLELEWRHVDREQQTLAVPGTKGRERKPHPVGAAVFDLLKDVPRPEGQVWVFPNIADTAKHVSKEVVESCWQRLREHAGIADVRLHDLRHTVGTDAGASGANAFIVRDLLRHSGVAMTARYVNKADAPIRSM